MTTSRRALARAALSLLTCAVSIAGCARDDGAAPASTSPPEVVEPEFLNGGECPPSPYPELPGDAGCVTSAVDAGDRLLVYARLDRDDMPRTWRVRLTSERGEIDQRLRESNVWSYPHAFGATDVNRDGDREWWIKVADYGSHGAAWGGLDLYLVEGGSLVPVTYAGEPLTVDFGGISRLGQGAVCRDGALVLLRTWALDRHNTRWAVSERRLELDGGRARFTGRRQHEIEVDSYTDPDLVRNYRVECYGTTFTPFD